MSYVLLTHIPAKRIDFLVIGLRHSVSRYTRHEPQRPFCGLHIGKGTS